MSAPLYDEKLVKILQTAIDPRTEETVRIAALNGAASHLAARGIAVNDLAIIYQGQDQYGMSDLLPNMKSIMDRSLAEAEEARATMRRYRIRLASLEAALRRIKQVVRNIEPLDKNDLLLGGDADKIDPEA